MTQPRFSMLQILGVAFIAAGLVCCIAAVVDPGNPDSEGVLLWAAISGWWNTLFGAFLLWVR